jgi:hypothetical protein
MAESTPPATKLNLPSVHSFKFDEEQCKEHFKMIRNHLNDYVAVSGYNPFTWASKYLYPLEQRMNNGERTKELYDAILGLKKEKPIVFQHNVDNPPVEAQAAGRASNAGQTIMQGMKKVGEV